MRPIELELRGFTAFRERTVVSFEDRRLFVITGPTGAGKSSLLDAMTWALYGQVPRVGRETRQLISHGQPSMAVRLDFAVRGDRYRVSRQAPGNVGARLEVSRDGAWVSLADRAREVTEQVSVLIGLDYATFTKTVLLPQGAFDSFLRGDERQRREILTGLLGLELYERVGSAARSRASGAGAAASTLREQIERMTFATPGAMGALEAQRASLEAQRHVVDQHRRELEEIEQLARVATEATTAAEAVAVSLRAAEQRAEEATQAYEASVAALEVAREQHAGLLAEREELAYDADAHRELARRAEQARRRLDAEAALDRAAQVAEAAKAVAAETGRRLVEARGSLEELDALAASAAAAGADAEEALLRAAGHADALAGVCREQSADLEARRAAVEAALAEHEARYRALEALAERRREALAREGRARQPVVDAQAADAGARAALQAATESLAEAERAAQEAGRQLERSRSDHAAATLQRTLKPGDTCPVCGEEVTAIHEVEAPDLDEAETRRASADAELVRARAASGTREREAAAAEAVLAEAQATLVRAESERVALDAEVHEVAGAAGVDAALTSVLAGTDEARGERQTLAARAAAVAETERALAMLLTRVPAGVERWSAEPPLPEGLSADEADVYASRLEEALREYAAASEASSRGRVAAEEARREVQHLAEQGAAGDARALAAEAALHEASEFLAAIAAEAGEGVASPAEVLRELQRLEGLAERDATVSQQVLAAAERVAASEASVTARLEARDRAAEQRDAAIVEARVAAGARAEAAAAFEAAWQQGEYPEGPPRSETLPQLARDLEARGRDLDREAGAVAAQLETARREAAAASHMRVEASERERDARLAGALEQELHRNRFIAYIQREAMQLLAQDASSRLEQLSSGRYRLRSELGEFMVMDRLNGDELRSVKTLSGGETFLASLALALALSERLPELAGLGGAMSLESLFLDEGFGALDQESLDVAIGGLESLSGGQRMIGVISHVPEVAERLADRIEVVKSGATSTVRSVRDGSDEGAADADGAARSLGAACA